MKIKIDSNFFLPGLEEESEIDVNRVGMTLRVFLEELSARSSGRIQYILPTGMIDPMSFSITLNGLPIDGSRESLETALNNGDTIAIQLSPLGGG